MFALGFCFGYRPEISGLGGHIFIIIIIISLFKQRSGCYIAVWS